VANIRLRSRPVAQDLRHRKLGVIIQDCGTPPKKAKAATCPSQKAWPPRQDRLDERRIAVRQIHAEIVEPHQLAVDDPVRLAEIFRGALGQ
jgi:hypothetical protein